MVLPNGKDIGVTFFDSSVVIDGLAFDVMEICYFCDVYSSFDSSLIVGGHNY